MSLYSTVLCLFSRKNAYSIKLVDCNTDHQYKSRCQLSLVDGCISEGCLENEEDARKLKSVGIVVYYWRRVPINGNISKCIHVLEISDDSSSFARTLIDKEKNQSLLFCFPLVVHRKTIRSTNDIFLAALFKKNEWNRNCRMSLTYWHLKQLKFKQIEKLEKAQTKIETIK